MAQSKEFVDASHALNDLSHALALLESENASLRGAVDGLCNENAKLRELVVILMACVSVDDCDKCPINGAEFKVSEVRCCYAAKQRMRELGVEVSE